jgi:hypothetical protein
MHQHTLELIEHCSEYAKELLSETLDFYPFGAFVSKTGQVHPLELEPENKNSTKNGEVVDSLLKYLITEFEKGEIIAYATVYEVEYQLNKDEPSNKAFAIKIINSASEEPMFYYPYSITGPSVDFKEPFAVKVNT